MRTALVLLSLLLSAAAAARPAPRVLKKLSLEQRTEAPTFYHGSALEPMDRDRLLYLGSGMWQEQEVFYLLRLRDLQTLTVRAPLAAYLDRFVEVVGRDKRPTHRYFQIQRLLFYDRDTAAAAVEASDDAGARKVTRHFYFHWDLKKGAFTEATLVARTRGRGSYTNPITVNPASSRLPPTEPKSIAAGIGGPESSAAATDLEVPEDRLPHPAPARLPQANDGEHDFGIEGRDSTSTGRFEPLWISPPLLGS